MLNGKGKKRPVLRGPNGRMTPVPWIGGEGPEMGWWAFINSDRAAQSENGKLCIVCGLERGDDWVYALLNGEPSDLIQDGFFGPPSPTFGHPECILKAVLYCPHLKKQEYPAMKQDRVTKLTTEELKKIVKDRRILKKDVGSFALGSAAFSPKIKRDKALMR